MHVVKAPNNEKDERLIRLVNQYQGMLLRMGYVYLKDMELAKDAAQETFLKAYKALSGFRGECSAPHGFETWTGTLRRRIWAFFC